MFKKFLIKYIMLEIQSLIKYVLEGLAVAVAAYYIPRKTVDLKEVGIIAVTAAAVFLVLDQFTPLVSGGARRGAGFGIGYNITRGLEGYEDSEDSEDNEDKPSASDPPVTDSEESESEDTSSEEEESVDYTPADNVGEPFASIL
jgi:hypothetical protein